MSRLNPFPEVPFDDRQSGSDLKMTVSRLVEIAAWFGAAMLLVTDAVTAAIGQHGASATAIWATPLKDASQVDHDDQVAENSFRL